MADANLLPTSAFTYFKYRIISVRYKNTKTQMRCCALQYNIYLVAKAYVVDNSSAKYYYKLRKCHSLVSFLKCIATKCLSGVRLTYSF